MKLLLDTHIWLWMALDSKRLAPRVGKVLDDPKNELWLSSISVWELTVLCRKGRFRTLSELPVWVAGAAGLVVMMGWHHPYRGRRGAKLQQKWRAARRHKADGYVGPKQQSYQQQAGK